MILRGQDLTLHFGAVAALQDVTVEVAGGEIVAVIGPNGAGKTALLNCLNGIYKPDAGSIHLGSRLLDGLRPDEIAALGVGRSFQHLELFDRLTVLENLLVARYAKTGSGTLRCALFWGAAYKEELEQRAIVEGVIDFFELWPYRHQPSGSLPFGVQKLVGVARAMATDPEVLLLDEPGSGLTRDEKEDLARFLLRLRDDVGIPILWVEHDIQLVLDLADRIHVLDSGKTIATGKPEAIKNDPDVNEAYLGEKSPRKKSSP